MELPTSRSGQGAAGSAGRKLVVSAPLPDHATETVSVMVERGMPVVDCDGLPAGHVAGLVCDLAQHAATHLLVAHWQAALDYRVVPIEHVALAAPGGVRLALSLPAISHLPTWFEFSATDTERNPTHDDSSCC